MKIKKVIAMVVAVLISLVLTVAFYDWYLYNMYVTNRYLSNDPGQQIQVVVVIIPPGAGSDLRTGFEPAVISIVIGEMRTRLGILHIATSPNSIPTISNRAETSPTPFNGPESIHTTVTRIRG